MIIIGYFLPTQSTFSFLAAGFYSGKYKVSPANFESQKGVSFKNHSNLSSTFGEQR